MIRYLIYFIALYMILPFSATVDFLTILVFFIIMNEDPRFAIVFAFITGLLVDLYIPVRLGVNTLIYITIAQVLLLLKKYLMINPLTIISTFVVFLLVKTALTNLLVSGPLSPLHIVYSIVLFFPIIMVLNRINFGTWMRV
jgi:rod shape-determining protein MreD